MKEKDRQTERREGKKEGGREGEGLLQWFWFSPFYDNMSRGFGSTPKIPSVNIKQRFKIFYTST